MKRVEREVNERVLSGLLGDGRVRPLLARVLARRAVKTRGDVSLQLRGLLSYRGLKGAEEAAGVLLGAIRGGKRILVVSDYDADGATSTAIMLKCVRGLLRAEGKSEELISFLLPDRMKHGYGLTMPVAELVVERGPDVVVTVDNGISSKEAIGWLRGRGIPVVVTDHHDCPPADRFPSEAEVVVNPKQEGCGFESKDLAGCGVAFYVCWALLDKWRGVSGEGGVDFADELLELLPFCAIGTIADVVRLDRNNRILVSNGMRLIREGRASAGVRALGAVALIGGEVAKTTKVVRRIPSYRSDLLTTMHIGFQVGPRINAAGRLETMSLGIEALLEEDEGLALKRVRILTKINGRRKEVEAGVVGAVVEELEREAGAGGGGGMLIFSGEGWHAGVIGIAAGRVKEAYGVPVFVFTGPVWDEVGGRHVYKGSGRSVEGLNLRHAMDTAMWKLKGEVGGIADKVKYGGHAAAAGATVPAEIFNEFKGCLKGEVDRELEHNPVERVVRVDGELGCVSQEEVEECLRYPWGQGFEAPLFRGRVCVREVRVVLQKVEEGGVAKWSTVILKVEDLGSGVVYKAVKFRWPLENKVPVVGAELDVLYRVDLNYFKGVTSVQWIVEDLGVGEQED